MTLTPSQRLEAYRWAKENFQTNQHGPYLCNVLEVWALDNEQNPDDIDKLFPEFWECRPKGKIKVEPWFESSDNASRHQVLDKCISEVQKLIEVKQ